MSIIDLPVRRPVAFGMLFLALVVLGLVAWQRLPLELMPVLRGTEPEADREILMPLNAKVSALPLVAEGDDTVRGSVGSHRVRLDGASARGRAEVLATAPPT